MSIAANTTILNKYRILRQIGEGGMGRVWLAEEIAFGNRPVAIKEVRREGMEAAEFAEQDRRFRQEVDISARLVKVHAPYVVTALTAERDEDGTLLLVMEYAGGGSVADLLRQQPNGLGVDTALRLARQVCAALAALHNLPDSPVHRDIKPSNILLTEDGEARLSDFGLAQLAGASGGRTQMTASQHPGTPLYMAPEQVSSAGYLSPAADIYALGCVLFEMLTGKRYKNREPGTLPSTLNAAVPPWLDAAVAKALAKEPWDRFENCTDFAAALVQPVAAKSKRAWLLGAALAVVAILLAAGAWLALGSFDGRGAPPPPTAPSVAGLPGEPDQEPSPRGSPADQATTATTNEDAGSLLLANAAGSMTVETETPLTSAIATESPIETPTETPSVTVTETPTDIPTERPTETLTATATGTDTPLPSATASATASATPTPTDIPTPSNTPTPLPTETPSQTPTSTPDLAATATAAADLLSTSVAATLTAIPTATATPTITPDYPATETAVANRMATSVAATLTAMPTATPSPTWTNTPLPTDTPMPTPDLTGTAIARAQAVETAVAQTLTAQPTSTATRRPTSTPTPRQTPTRTPTRTPTPRPMADDAAQTSSTSRQPPGSTLRLAYAYGDVGDSDIRVADADLGTVIAVADQNCDEAEPAWSPDGRYIVYQSDCDGSYDIYRVDAGGGRTVRLTATANRDEREASYSPDGDRIVYRSSMAGGDRNNDGELWVMNADGSGAINLGIVGRAPRWSPDGLSLVLMSNRDGHWDIYRHDLLSGETKRLTACDDNCRWPAWSPDSRQIVYHSTTGPDSTTAETIWIMPATGGAPRQLTTGENAGRPTWSRDGLIAFNSNRGIEYVWDDGSDRSLFIESSDNWAPAWSR